MAAVVALRRRSSKWQAALHLEDEEVGVTRRESEQEGFSRWLVTWIGWDFNRMLEGDDCRPNPRPLLKLSRKRTRFFEKRTKHFGRTSRQ